MQTQRPKPPARLVSLTTPGVRLTVVEVVPYPDDDSGEWECSHEFHSVVAVAGLVTEGGHASFEPVMVGDPTWGLMLASEIECSNTLQQTVPCPWPPDEDEERLAPVVRDLTERLMKGLDATPA